MAMKITVIGLGYLGATHAVAMAELGHQVIGIEANPKRLGDLQNGVVPFFEPGLDEALQAVIAKGNIKFQAEHTEESREADLHFLCVGTPQLPGSYAANTQYLHDAVRALAPYLREDAVIAGKSTVPVGTAAKLTEVLAEAAGFQPHLAWNPEFLREGTALEDSLRPDRIVIGVSDERSAELLRKVYEPITAHGTPFITTDIPTAELVKVAANSFLATKISFINAMAEIAEVAGADAVSLAEAIGYDERIGNKFLRNGIGFGGGCLPKDIRAFMARAEELGVGQAVDFLADVDSINLRRRARVVDLLKRELGSIAGKRILVLGAAFKPDSDDLRDSPSIAVAKLILAEGANVVVHDPISLDHVRATEPSLIAEQDLVKAATGAEAIVLATEWSNYRTLDLPAELAPVVANKLIIDGRNALKVAAWQSAGFRLIALGRNVEA
ncbi:MAG: UDP-glucose dehydrogenase family protein [Micrococcales bacterium]